MKDSLKNNAWPCLLIIVVTLIAFWPSLHNGFTDWDDNRYVTGNPLIRDLSAEGIKNIFTRVVTGKGHYHPLTILSFALEYHFFKLDPFIYHLDNLLLHVINTLLVYYFILRLAGERRAAFITAILFGVHPMHVESVAWIVERKDVLSTFFYLAALISYLHQLDAPQKRSMPSLLVIFLYSASLLSKPSAISLPLVLLCCNYYRGRKFSWSLIKEKLPLFVLAGIFGLLAIAQKASADLPYPVIDRMLFCGYALTVYFGKLLLPFNLSAFYDFPQKSPQGFYPIVFYIAPAVVVILFLLIWKLFRRNKDVIFGLLVFLFSIAPMLGIVRFGNYLMGERYTYFSYIGLFFILSRGFEAFLQTPRVSSSMKLFGKILMGVFILMCAWLTFWRCPIWNNAFTLWNDVISKNPWAALAYASRGAAYNTVGKIELAFADLSRAIELNPQLQHAYINRGIIYSKINRNDLAIDDFNRAERLKGNAEGVYLNRGVAYSRLKQWERAINDFDAALRLKPDMTSAYLNKGNVYFEQGAYNKAIEQYTRALALDPESTAAYYARGLAFARLGNKEASERDLMEAGSRYSM